MTTNIKDKNTRIEKIKSRIRTVKPRVYENQDIVDNVDKIHKEILEVKKNNHHRDHFFPLLIDKMNLKVGVEIGVDKATFSQHILNRSKIEKYYCVDTWQDNFGSGFKPDYFAKDGNVRFNEASSNLKDHIDRVMMMRMNSMEAVSKFEDNSLDFCYIDGDHSLEGIYEDVVHWTPKVKIGGIIAGHDYKDGKNSGINNFFGEQLDYRIKTVVDDYTDRHGHKLIIVGAMILSWFFVKNR